MDHQTVEYYDENAGTFVDGTVGARMGDILGWFLSRVPEHGRVLDWGCGSGRDAKAMLDVGYRVDATDASAAMCVAASALTGLRVRHEDFSALDADRMYDGIWASASLLHVASEDLAGILDIAARALKPGGVLYCSFKRGSFEGVRDGRYFTDLDEAGFANIIDSVPSLDLLEIKVTFDVRPGREDELWLNCLTSRR